VPDLGRRAFAAAGAVALAGCDALVSGISRSFGVGLPDRIEPPSGARPSAAHHLLNRAAFGPWPGDVASVESMGTEAWIDEQLDPSAIDDTACDVRTAFIDAAHLPPDLALEIAPEHVEQQLVAFTLLKATYSRRQLAEVMTEAWSDHFNVAIGKDLCRHFKPSDDREVIRRHALGSFRALLEASAKSPAMLVYLDGRDNRVERSGQRPNENYARELLELHTLGVHGGYTQEDVMEAARCLSGWVVHEEWRPGAVEFDPSRHDDGEKVVLGQRIAAGQGARDLEHLLDIVVAHPPCAPFIAHKLCRVFVADDPPASIVASAAETFRATDGDIARVVRDVLRSPEFEASSETKLKRPFRFVVSALRALGADTHARSDFSAHLARMGHAPFEYPTPDGYPLEADAWLGTLLSRWNFALSLAEGQIGGTTFDLAAISEMLGARPDDGGRPFLRHLLGRDPAPSELAPIDAYLRGPDAIPARAVALMLSSPGFQRC
jgi:uncharacterized protein (DUF1800 family)